MIDVRAAVQIANFVVHEQGTTWRYADVAVFGRFVPRENGENLEDFVKDDELRFQEGCPLSEIKRVDLEWKPSRMHEFLVKSYACAGAASEVVGIAQVADFFVLFSLTSRKGQEAIQRGMNAFQELMESFRFLPTPKGRPPALPEAKKP